jgi:hypothetical protein
MVFGWRAELGRIFGVAAGVVSGGSQGSQGYQGG